MAELQINAALMGLLIAGGMLIPGNIPNIISANKLGITSKEWAKLGCTSGRCDNGSLLHNPVLAEKYNSQGVLNPEKMI